MADLTDPAHATDHRLSRRNFTILSGTATALAATVVPASGDALILGRPHAPFVAEADPALSIARPTIAYGGRSLSAYYAAPRDGRLLGGVVVVQAIWGLDAQLRDTVRRLAKEGYAALAPDLYAGLDAPSGDGATDFAPFRDVAAKLVDATVDGDLAAAADYLRSSDRQRDMPVGVVGFCMGGGITLRQAVDDTKFKAASVFYGKVRYGTTGNAGPITPIALAYVDSLKVPLAGSWGERDTSIVAADVRALDAALTERKRVHDVKIYEEAGHAFFDDTRDSYVASAATDAWTRTLAWFGHYLT